MRKANFATVPIRCETCGQQTHATLASVLQNGGLMCACGTFNEINVQRLEAEISKSEANIRDFGAKG